MKEDRRALRIGLDYRARWLAGFEANRIGLCYHLPLVYKGVTSRRGETFPVEISP